MTNAIRRDKAITTLQAAVKRQIIGDMPALQYPRETYTSLLASAAYALTAKKRLTRSQAENIAQALHAAFQLGSLAACRHNL